MILYIAIMPKKGHEAELPYDPSGESQIRPFEKGIGWMIFFIPGVDEAVTAFNKWVLGKNPDTGKPFPSKEDFYEDAIRIKFF